MCMCVYVYMYMCGNKYIHEGARNFSTKYPPKLNAETILKIGMDFDFTSSAQIQFSKKRRTFGRPVTFLVPYFPTEYPPKFNARNK